MADLMRRMHEKFRLSKAPYLRAFVGSINRGIEMFGLRGFTAGLYLQSATEGQLLEWADAYAISTHGLSESELRDTIRREALTRNRTTEDAIEQAIFRLTGVAAAIRPSKPHVAYYDQQERAEGGYRMADYAQFDRRDTGIVWGGLWGEEWPGQTLEISEDDPTHLGYRGLTPGRECFGASGFIVYVASEYDEQTESHILAVLKEQVAAMKGYSIFWSHAFEVAAREVLFMPDHEAQQLIHGWGCAPWGRAWASPAVTAPACPTDKE